MQAIAGKAICFGEALRPEFSRYAHQVVANCQTLAGELSEAGMRLISGGTDNHLLLIDCVSSWDITGRQAEELFDRVGITLNKNVIADDPRKPLDPSGIRLGTPAVTTRGMKEPEMDDLVDFMRSAVASRDDESALGALHEDVKTFCRKYPVPGIDS